MKNLAPIFIVMTSAFSFSCFAQPSKNDTADNTLENTQSLSDLTAENNRPIASYHVEERINMPFGSRITTYDVSSLSLVSTNDLGPNNVRKVTARYAKVRESVQPIVKAIAKTTVPTELPKIVAVSSIPKSIPLKLETVPTEVKKKYVYVDILSTYERVLDKGYKSVDMFKKVADNRFFGGDMSLAVKWYSQLFAMTTDLDSVYFYRYAESLKSVGLVDKAKEMMAVFENKKP